jgi:hypothetical protein
VPIVRAAQERMQKEPREHNTARSVSFVRKFH